MCKKYAQICVSDRLDRGVIVVSLGVVSIFACVRAPPEPAPGTSSSRPDRATRGRDRKRREDRKRMKRTKSRKTMERMREERRTKRRRRNMRRERRRRRRRRRQLTGWGIGRRRNLTVTASHSLGRVRVASGVPGCTGEGDPASRVSL